MRDETRAGCLTVLGIASVFLLVAGVAWFESAMEARSYRKFCDRDVSTWDALWLDLRIDECDGRERP